LNEVSVKNKTLGKIIVFAVALLAAALCAAQQPASASLSQTQ
jgi:hypothetical protein